MAFVKCLRCRDLRWEQPRRSAAVTEVQSCHKCEVLNGPNENTRSVGECVHSGHIVRSPGTDRTHNNNVSCEALRTWARGVADKD